METKHKLRKDDKPEIKNKHFDETALEILREERYKTYERKESSIFK